MGQRFSTQQSRSTHSFPQRVEPPRLAGLEAPRPTGGARSCSSTACRATPRRRAQTERRSPSPRGALRAPRLKVKKVARWALSHFASTTQLAIVGTVHPKCQLQNSDCRAESLLTTAALGQVGRYSRPDGPQSTSKALGAAPSGGPASHPRGLFVSMALSSVR